MTEDFIKTQDATKKAKVPKFKKPDKDSLKTDTLNQFIEAAKVKDLSNWI